MSAWGTLNPQARLSDARRSHMRRTRARRTLSAARAADARPNDLGQDLDPNKLDSVPQSGRRTRTRLVHPCPSPDISTLTAWTVRLSWQSAQWVRMVGGVARRVRARGTHLLSTRTTSASGGTSVLALRVAFTWRVHGPVAAAWLGIDGGREESRSGRSSRRSRCRAAGPSPPVHGPAACCRRPCAAASRRCAVALRTRMD